MTSKEEKRLILAPQSDVAKSPPYEDCNPDSAMSLESEASEAKSEDTNFIMDVSKTELCTTTMNVSRDKSGRLHYSINKRTEYKMDGLINSSPTVRDRIRKDSVANDFIPDLCQSKKRHISESDFGTKPNQNEVDQKRRRDKRRRKRERKKKQMEKVHEESEQNIQQVLFTGTSKMSQASSENSGLSQEMASPRKNSQSSASESSSNIGTDTVNVVSKKCDSPSQKEASLNGKSIKSMYYDQFSSPTMMDIKWSPTSPTSALFRLPPELKNVAIHTPSPPVVKEQVKSSILVNVNSEQSPSEVSNSVQPTFQASIKSLLTKDSKDQNLTSVNIFLMPNEKSSQLTSLEGTTYQPKGTFLEECNVDKKLSTPSTNFVPKMNFSEKDNKLIASKDEKFATKPKSQVTSKVSKNKRTRQATLSVQRKSHQASDVASQKPPSATRKRKISNSKKSAQAENDLDLNWVPDSEIENWQNVKSVEDSTLDEDMPKSVKIQPVSVKTDQIEKPIEKGSILPQEKKFKSLKTSKSKKNDSRSSKRKRSSNELEPIRSSRDLAQLSKEEIKFLVKIYQPSPVLTNATGDLQNNSKTDELKVVAQSGSEKHKVVTEQQTSKSLVSPPSTLSPSKPVNENTVVTVQSSVTKLNPPQTVAAPFENAPVQNLEDGKVAHHTSTTALHKGLNVMAIHNELQYPEPTGDAEVDALLLKIKQRGEFVMPEKSELDLVKSNCETPFEAHVRFYRNQEKFLETMHELRNQLVAENSNQKKPIETKEQLIAAQQSLMKREDIFTEQINGSGSSSSVPIDSCRQTSVAATNSMSQQPATANINGNLFLGLAAMATVATAFFGAIFI